MNSESCPNCSRLSLPFASVTSLGNYEKSMRELVIEMKRPGREALGIQLGQWLGREISTQTWLGKLDMVTPVPIHWTRMLRRGYHVADLLVEGIQRRIDGLRKDRLIRYVRRTKKQGRLTTRQRFDNVRRCFAAVDPARLREKRILVVDDVMTSGATAIQAATSLLRCGAEQVHLAIVARGVGRR